MSKKIFRTVGKEHTVNFINRFWFMMFNIELKTMKSAK